MLVPVVLVAEPRRRAVGFGQSGARQQSGLMGEDVIGIGESHGQEHRRRRGRRDRLFECPSDLGWTGALGLGEVLVVREFQPHRRGVEKRHGRSVLFAP